MKNVENWKLDLKHSILRDDRPKVVDKTNPEPQPLVPEEQSVAHKFHNLDRSHNPQPDVAHLTLDQWKSSAVCFADVTENYNCPQKNPTS